jgi:hypothetical protein
VIICCVPPFPSTDLVDMPPDLRVVRRTRTRDAMLEPARVGLLRIVEITQSHSFKDAVHGLHHRRRRGTVLLFDLRPCAGSVRVRVRQLGTWAGNLGCGWDPIISSTKASHAASLMSLGMCTVSVGTFFSTRCDSDDAAKLSPPRSLSLPIFSRRAA